MDNNIIKIDEENLKNDLKGVIRKTIEETLNTMLDEEAAGCATRKGMSGQTSAGTTAAVITTASF